MCVFWCMLLLLTLDIYIYEVFIKWYFVLFFYTALFSCGINLWISMHGVETLIND